MEIDLAGVQGKFIHVFLITFIIQMLLFAKCVVLSCDCYRDRGRECLFDRNVVRFPYGKCKSINVHMIWFECFLWLLDCHRYKQSESVHRTMNGISALILETLLITHHSSERSELVYVHQLSSCNAMTNKSS